jgi:glycogen operon protein
MFAGKTKSGREDAVFIAINSYWENCRTELPELPKGYSWNCEFYTYLPFKKGEDVNSYIDRSGYKVVLAPRSVMIFSVRYDEK